MTNYLVRASALLGVRATIESLGGDADDIFLRLGLPLHEPDRNSWISYRSFLLLLDVSSRVTGCQHFGLKLSQHQDLDILGPLSFIMQQAPDIRTALSELTTYFAHHNQGARVLLNEESGLAFWEFECKLAGTVNTGQQIDQAMGIGLKIMRLLCKPSWKPTAVYLGHAPTTDVRPYKELMNCPVYFDRGHNLMTFDAAVLDAPISEANSELHAVLADHLNQLHSAYPNDFLGQVRHLIRQAMDSGDCSLPVVANYLAINKRTLQRQLAAEGSSYKELLDEVRFDVALTYLRESNGSLTALAELLCYSELSAFSNAFTNRFGVSPRQWKKQHQLSAMY